MKHATDQATADGTLQLLGYIYHLEMAGWTVTLGGPIAQGQQVTQTDPVDPATTQLVWQSDPERNEDKNRVAEEKGKVGGYIGHNGVVAWWTRNNNDSNAENAKPGEAAEVDKGGWTWEFVFDVVQTPANMMPEMPPVIAPIIRIGGRVPIML